MYYLDMGIPVDGVSVVVPGVDAYCYLDDWAGEMRPPRTPKKYSKDTSCLFLPRNVEEVAGVCWHNFHGDADGGVIEDPLLCADNRVARLYAKSFSRLKAKASAAACFADDGKVFFIADCKRDRTLHARRLNPFTIGNELDSEGDHDMCDLMLDACVKVAWWYSEYFYVQPMIPAIRVNGVLEPDLRDVPLWNQPRDKDSVKEIKKFRGHYFHANFPERGFGDPGKAPGRKFLQSGFEGFDVRAGEHIEVWKDRQKWLGVSKIDGIPGRETTEKMIEKLGRRTWVQRVKI